MWQSVIGPRFTLRETRVWMRVSIGGFGKGEWVCDMGGNILRQED